MRFWAAVALSAVLFAGEAYGKYNPAARYRSAANSIPADNDPMPSSLKVTAEPVIPGDDSTAPSLVSISDNGLHAAFVIAGGSRVTAVIDGKIGPKFDTIESDTENGKPFIFSLDGAHAAYLARSDSNLTLVVDDAQIPAGEDAAGVSQTLTFSPDGSQYAFVSRSGAKDTVVLNGKPQSLLCNDVANLCFTPHGKHLFYIASVPSPTGANCKVLVIDGKLGPAFADIREFSFSADGQHYAYIGDDTPYSPDEPNPQQKSHLIVDGSERAAFPRIVHITLSRDGAHAAALLARAAYPGPYSMYLDGKTWDFSYGRDDIGPPLLSPDGTRVAYVQYATTSAISYCVFVNGKKGLNYTLGVDQLAFSSDSQHIYYTAQTNGPDNRPTTFVVRDEDEAGPYVEPGKLIFSPDGNHVCYPAGDGTHVFVVADGTRGEDFDQLNFTPVYSADSQHYFFSATRNVTRDMKPMDVLAYRQDPNHDTGNYFVVDGKRQMIPASLFNFYMRKVVMSPDGAHIAFASSNSMVLDLRSITPTSASSASGTPAGVPFFSPDNKHLVCQWLQQGGSLPIVCVDADEIPAYHPVAPPAFAGDGRLVYFANKGDGISLYRVTVDMGVAPNPQTAAATPDLIVVPAVSQPIAQQPPPPPAPPVSAAALAPAAVQASAPPPAPLPPPAAPAPQSTVGIGDVAQQDIPAYDYVFTSTQTTGNTIAASMQELAGKVLPMVQSGALRPTGPFIYTIHNLNPDPNQPCTLDLGIVVADGTTPPAGMTMINVPAHRSAVVRVTGPGSLLGPAYAKLYGAIIQKGWKTTQINRQVIVNFDAPDSVKNIVDVQADLQN